MERVQVKAQTAVGVDVDIVERCVVVWEFEVEAFDISFSVNFTPAAGAAPPLVVQPALRVKRDSNRFTAPGAGRVHLSFDNNYSMLRSKALLYSVRVIDAAAKPAAASIEDSGEGHTHVEESLECSTPYGDGYVEDRRGMDGILVVRLAYGRAFLQASVVQWKKILPTAGVEVEGTRSGGDALPVGFADANKRAMVGIRLFFTNQFTASEEFFSTERNRLPIFALGHACNAFLRAQMTWEPSAIAEALARLQHTQRLAGVFMPSGWTFSSKPLTPSQLEGTLVYAEATLLVALLQLMEESVMGFVKAGLSIRSAWKYLQQCDAAVGGIQKLLKTNEVPAGVNDAVLGGIFFGVGTFNCLTSALPPIILKVVEMLGFPADRVTGFAALKRCHQLGGIRAPLASIIILGAFVLLPGFITGPTATIYAADAERLLDAQLSLFPESALFLWIAGRLARLRRQPEEANRLFERCASATAEWVQLKHLAANGSYERGLGYLYSGAWARSRECFALLEAESGWSKAFYAYAQAVAAFEMGDFDGARRLMLRAPAYVVRKFGGKTISAEQFVLRRADCFNRVADPTIDTLLLPGIETVYLFNGFPQMSPDGLVAALVKIDTALARLAGAASGAAFVADFASELSPSAAAIALLEAAVKGPVFGGRLGMRRFDAIAVSALCRGAALLHIGRREEAVATLQWIIDNDGSLDEERYVVPFAMYELGCLIGPESPAGCELLKQAKGLGYDYLFKVPLHFRIHLMQSGIYGSDAITNPNPLYGAGSGGGAATAAAPVSLSVDAPLPPN